MESSNSLGDNNVREKALEVFREMTISTTRQKDPITPIEQALLDVHLSVIKKTAPLVNAIKKSRVHLLGDCECETTGACYHALRDLFINSGIVDDFEEQTKI